MNTTKSLILLLLTAAFLTLMSPLSQAQSSPSAWTEVKRPEVERGLIYQPRLCAIRSRIHMFWAGTGEKMRRPELHHASIRDGDDAFGVVKAPFFGNRMGGVRRIACGNARHMLALLFQRASGREGRAYEVLLSISNDQGWSFSTPFVVDGFVTAESGGTWVSVDGREGTNRPEFALAWSAENDTVRGSTIDIESRQRPRAATLGQHAPGIPKVEVASKGRSGFSIIWNAGESLQTADLRALTGGASDTTTLVRGTFEKAFSLAGWHRGPARALAVEAGTAVRLKAEKDWDDVGKGPFPMASSLEEMRSDLDDDRVHHVAFYTGINRGNKIYYLRETDDGWSKPELVLELDKDLDCTGFDIAVSSDSVWVVATQGVQFSMKKKPLHS